MSVQLVANLALSLYFTQVKQIDHSLEMSERANSACLCQ